jgi:hypothetical protein
MKHVTVSNLTNSILLWRCRPARLLHCVLLPAANKALLLRLCWLLQLVGQEVMDGGHLAAAAAAAVLAALHECTVGSHCSSVCTTGTRRMS